MTRRVARLALVGAAVVLLAPWATAPAGAADDPQVVCRFTDDRLTEISGITWSAKHPGTYWVHNDSSGGPYLYAVDGTTCATRARIRVTGIGARDLEAVATGIDPSGKPVLWLGDIGDNRDSWPSVRLHAVPEPAQLVDQEVRATTYRFTYDDGAHNAESVIADPVAARVWVVSRQLAAGAVWSVPLSATTVTTATRVGLVRGLVTDAAMSPDGTRYVIRDYVRASVHRAPVSAASLAAGSRVDLPGQLQGEAITFTADGTALLVASEREGELWRVALPDGLGSEPAPSASATQGPSGSGTTGPSGSASAGGDTSSASPGGAGPVRALLAGAALLGALGIGVLAARRLRH